jgi:WD40 repeat protein
MLPHPSEVRNQLVIDPSGEHVLSMGYGSDIFLLSTLGGEPRRFKGFPPSDYVEASDFSPSGKLVAAASEMSNTRPTLRVWDLETDEVRVFDLPERPVDASGESGLMDNSVFHVAFTDESTVYTDGRALLRWDLETGSYEQLLDPAPNGPVFMFMSANRQTMASYRYRDARTNEVPVDLRNLATGETQRLMLPSGARSENLNSDGSIWIAGGIDGLIKVVRTDGGDVHLLAGHEGPVTSLAISPDNEWIASSGEDKTLRLWPMPDLSKPPLHTLPHDELLAKLKSLTNLRAVRDGESSTGWKIEVGPFPGWAKVPEW